MDSVMEHQPTFDFSIIMAVYNVEPYLREAVDSVINQDFDFERVQLILVDDGSPDASGAICDEYHEAHENVFVIHKENGGQGSARNAGLEIAAGRFINFMDPDDKLSKNALSRVYNFFDEHEDETDIVAIPMIFFDGQHGPHWQNTKFQKGSRIIYLKDEYKTQQTSASSTFYSRNVFNLLKFDTILPNNEDFKINLRVFAEKFTLGVVDKCTYWYRRRASGPISTVQGILLNRRWYCEWFTNLCDWACDFYTERFGYIPAFVQYGILCDILWRYKSFNADAMKMTLSDEEIVQYYDRLKCALQRFDDKYILEIPQLSLSHRCLMLKQKYNGDAELCPLRNDLLLNYRNTRLGRISTMYTEIAFISIARNILLIEGHQNLFGLPDDTSIEIFFKSKDSVYPCEIIERPELSHECLGSLLNKGVGFRCRIDISAEDALYLKLWITVNGYSVAMNDLNYGRFSPISNEVANSYAVLDHHFLKAYRTYFSVQKIQSHKTVCHLEMSYIRKIRKINSIDAKKAIIARKFYHLLHKFQKKQIWLLSDRVTRAGDNGEAFFEYLCKNPPKDVTPYYVISGDSPDYERLKKIGHVVAYQSHKHKMLHLLASRIISSAGEDAVTNPFGEPGKWYRDIMARQKYIFLQHGVTKDDQSRWLSRYNKGIDGFVTSAFAEYHSILEGEGYYYNEKQVWLTGMPRFDRLYRDSKKKITIIPTWRKYLMTHYDAATGTWGIGNGFQESAYFLFYSQLLRHERLIAAARQYGYTLQFFPHPNIMQHIELFEADPSIEILHEDTEYRKIYAESDLLVTDYSSAVFDFAYLRQPIIYAHFDADEFFTGEHVYKKGYFEYERDGFGEVEHDLESTVDRIIEYMRNGCALKPLYRERIDNFFAFNDQNNCQRVYEKIRALDD